jgi:CheY-like chemotaxis protein
MELKTTNEFDWTGKTILIAEDELINFRLLEVLLTRTQATLLHGRTGLETLQLFHENPRIDMILMDIKMPEMDGCEVTRKIRETNPSVPIIAQTAYAIDEEREKSIEAGCNAYITKPINKTTLLNLMDSLL